MKTSIRIAACLLVLAGTASWISAQEKVVSTITITVPEKGQEETKVKVNGNGAAEPSALPVVMLPSD